MQRVALLLMLIGAMITWRENVARAATTTDMVTVNPNTVLNTLSPTFFGINDVGFWDSAQASPGSATALAQTPIKMVRFAGGDPGDWYDWAEPYYNGTSAGANSWSTQSPLDVWHYARQFGATPLFQTNFQGNGLPNPPVTPQTTCAVHAGSSDCELDSLFNGAGARQSYAVNSAQNAAAWVTYDKGAGISALMEVGNEEDIHMTSSDDSSFQPYITAFNAQATAMHQADPTVEVIGPAATNEWYWWYNPNNESGSNSPDSLNMFLKGTGNKHGSGQVDGVSLHYYVGGTVWGTAENSAQNWLSPTGDWATIQQSIQANDTRNLPVYVSEWNVGDSDSGTGFNQTLGHGLVVTDILGAFAQSGVAGEEYFDTHGGSTYGLLYGTGEGEPLDSATPAYYTTVLWKYMGNQILQESQSADPGTVMSTYASKSADGSYHFLAINKTGSTQPVQFALSGISLDGQQLQVASVVPQNGHVTDTGAYYNGVLNPSPQQTLPAPVAAGTISGDAVSYTVPAYSAVVLSVGGGSTAPTFTPTSTTNPNFTATPTNTPLPALSVTASGTLSASSVAPGGSEQMTSTVSSNQDVGPVIVQVAVYDSGGKQVYLDNRNETLLASSPLTLNDTYTVAANALGGTYYYQIGVFNTSWSTTYTYNSSAGTFTVTGAATPTPTATPPTVTASGSVSLASLPQGGTQTLKVNVTSSGTLNALVDEEVYDPSYAKVFQTTHTVTLQAGKPFTTSDSYAVSSTALTGTYYYKIGVFGPTWSPMYTWNNSAATFTVTAGGGGPTNTAVPATPSLTQTPLPSTATASNTAVPPTASVTSSETPVVPSATGTNTPLPPTATRTATHTPVPPSSPGTATHTPVVPTATLTRTPTPPTGSPSNTAVPPTASVTGSETAIVPSATATTTPLPPTATRTATHTPVPPSSPGTATHTPVVPTATLTRTPLPPTATITGTPTVAVTQTTTTGSNLPGYTAIGATTESDDANNVEGSCNAHNYGTPAAHVAQTATGTLMAFSWNTLPAIASIAPIHTLKGKPGGRCRA